METWRQSLSRNNYSKSYHITKREILPFGSSGMGRLSHMRLRVGKGRSVVKMQACTYNPTAWL